MISNERLVIISITQKEYIWGMGVEAKMHKPASKIDKL